MILEGISQIQFWWRNKDTGKGIHWHSWDKLAKKKNEGGLNFRHLEGFNMALLSKQLWRLCQNPHTILARTLQAKYYPRERSAFHAKVGSRPSYGWRSIMEGKKLLCMGLKKEFGNGDTIDLYKDPWLIKEAPIPIPKPAEPLQHTNPPLLHQLKDVHSDEWKICELRRYFDREECDRILKVKPGGLSSNEGYSWIHNSSGLYSVKSGYWLWNSSPLNPYPASEQRPNYSVIYEQIWTTETSNKVRNFLWRCLSSSLPVGVELRKKRITSTASCHLCGNKQETVNHLLFQCDLAQDVWRLTAYAPLVETTFKSSTLAQNLWSVMKGEDSVIFNDSVERHLWPWLMWRVWKARNEFLFQRLTTSAHFILGKSKSDAREWSDHNRKQARSVPNPLAARNPQTILRWTAPEASFLKCNVDASWQDNRDSCGVSWILRDHMGQVRLHGIKVFPRLLSPLEAEAAALVWAVNYMWNMGYEKVIFESDSQVLISALRDPLSCPRLATFVSEIVGITQRRPWQIEFHHISREKNVAADTLAKFALSFPIYFGSIDNSIPSWLQPSLE